MSVKGRGWTLAALVLMLAVMGRTAETADRDGAPGRPSIEVRRGREVFGKWMPIHGPRENQLVIGDVNLGALRLHGNPAYGRLALNKYREHGDFMADIAGLVRHIFGQDPRSVTGPAMAISPAARARLARLCTLMDRDVGGFFAYLRSNGLESAELNEAELRLASVESYVRYTSLLEMIFVSGDPAAEQARAMAAANRMVEYCFGAPTWPDFEAVLMDGDTHPLARFAYANLWYFLSGTGWKHWHRDAIRSLKRAFDGGARIVYIAGGNDVYQLLRAGIYDIEVIDPLLPSQPRYYAEGWDFLARDGALGDEITLDFPAEPAARLPGRFLVLRRVKYQAGTSFTARLNSGLTEEIPGGRTTWEIRDRDGGRLRGRLIFDRRFCRQEDFTEEPRRALVMSFNELYFVTTTESGKTWGIDPARFAPGFRLHVKQLRRPLTGPMIRRIREAENGPFRFLSLGSEVN